MGLLASMGSLLILAPTYTDQGTNSKRNTTLPTVSMSIPLFTYRKEGDKGTNLWFESNLQTHTPHFQTQLVPF